MQGRCCPRSSTLPSRRHADLRLVDFWRWCIPDEWRLAYLAQRKAVEKSRGHGAPRDDTTVQTQRA